MFDRVLNTPVTIHTIMIGWKTNTLLTSLRLGYISKIYFFIFISISPMITKLGRMVEWHALVLAIIPSLGRVANISKPAFTCSKLIMETLEEDVKYIQS